MTSSDKPVLSVVYVEDDADIRDLVAMTFEQQPSLVLTALAPAANLLEQIRNAHPHMVLLDVMMPDMDGRTIAAAMKADAQLASVPFVFMTAKARPQDLAELYKLGALGIISKPFDVVGLPTEISNLLAKHHSSSSGY